MKMFLYYQFNREDFMAHYHQRSNAESVFSMVKAKFRDNVRSRTDVAMKNEVLCKLLCHNICCVIKSHLELGIEPVFWKNEDNLPALKGRRLHTSCLRDNLWPMEVTKTWVLWLDPAWVEFGKQSPLPL